MDPSDFDVTALDDDLSEGLRLLAESREEVEPVADDGGNYIFISLGTFHLDDREPDYDQSEAEIYKRLDRRRLDGDHYGFVTDPPLTINGDDPDNTQREQDHAEPLVQALGIDEYMFWSRRLDELSLEEPEDVHKVYPHVRGCLNHPWD